MEHKGTPRNIPGQLKVRSLIVTVIVFLVFDLLATRAIRKTLSKPVQKEPSAVESNINRLEQRTSDSERRLRIVVSELAAQRAELAQMRLAKPETCAELQEEIVRLRAEIHQIQASTAHSCRRSSP
jgi:F0F1-type ATP synthase membrane subunit b/b'